MDEKIIIEKLSKILKLNKNTIIYHLSYQKIIELLVEAYENKNI